MKKPGFLSKAYIVLILIITYVPILLVVLYSFNESKLTSIWGGFSLKWYIELFKDKQLLSALTNSVVLGLLSSLCAAIIGTLGAVGMARTTYKLNGTVEYLSTLPIMIPEIVLGMVFLAFFSLIGMPFGMTALVIGHTAFCIPYVFILVKSRLAGMDKSYIEAAKDLGASETRAFIDITLPLITPAILAAMLLSFAMSMDDVIISMFLSNVNTTTLPLKIYSQLKTGVTPKTNALCTLMFLFTLFIGFVSYMLGRGPKYDETPKESRENS